MAIHKQTSALGSVTAGTPIPMNYHDYLPISIQLVVVSGTNTSSVEFTLDPILDPTYTGTATWTAFGSPFSGATTSVSGVVTNPVVAIRHNMTAWTSGSAYIKVLQGDRN
jgi:hypothetical protein